MSMSIAPHTAPEPALGPPTRVSGQEPAQVQPDYVGADRLVQRLLSDAGKQDTVLDKALLAKEFFIAANTALQGWDAVAAPREPISAARRDTLYGALLIRDAFDGKPSLVQNDAGIALSALRAADEALAARAPGAPVPDRVAKNVDAARTYLGTLAAPPSN